MSYAQQQSKIFIRQVTVLDCAIWDKTRGPLGRSWNVDVEWHGKTDEEGVVVDFSQAKKIAKNVIDEAFDHRLLISKNQIQKLKNGRLLCIPDALTAPENRFLIETYEHSLSLLPEDVFAELSTDETAQLEKHLAAVILQFSPKNIEKVKVSLRWHPEANEPHFFSYLHSLRLHNGNCQRFHGHSNTIEIFKDGRFDRESSVSAARFIDGKYLVTEQYLETSNALIEPEYSEVVRSLELNQGTHTWLDYSGTQGQVRVCVPTKRLVLMPDESTIENIVRWLHVSHFSGRSDIEVRGYEGLHKGALFP